MGVAVLDALLTVPQEGSVIQDLLQDFSREPPKTGSGLASL
jgi:hypothetical protein